MNVKAQREAAITQVRAFIDEKGLAAEFGAKAISRFIDFLRVQMPSVAEKYAADPNKIRVAIANNFSNLPEADATIMPVRGGQPFNTRRTRGRK